jgi:RNA polymerase sigma factor (sigma-70 family)
MSKKPLSTNEMTDTSNDFERMYESNAPLIYRFMFWRTKDEMLAQDLTSNVFEKAWRTRTSFTGGSAKAWLFRIARTTLIDHWRKIKDLPDDGHIIAEAVSDNADLDQAFDQQMAVAELQKAVTKLPKGMKGVVELRFIEGKSVRETGMTLHISEANVRVMQYRALQKLRTYLQ